MIATIETEFSSAEQFEIQKTAFFSDFALKNYHLWKFHEKGQLLGENRKREHDPWTTAEHTLICGVLGYILAEDLGVSNESRDTIAQALILHDWFKRTETAQMTVDGTFTIELFNEIKRVDMQTLRDGGISEEVVKLTDANTPDTIDGQQTEEREVVWLVDAIVSNTDIVSVNQRFTNSCRGWDGEKENSKRKAFSLAMNNMFSEKYGQSITEIQLRIGSKILQKFSEKLGFEGDPENFHLYVTQRLAERILTYEPNSFRF